jgi:hypothetical protein
MFPGHIKDLLIAVLSFHVVVDVMLTFATKARHPGLFATLQRSMEDENVMVVVAIGLGVAVLVYWLARRSREMFTTKKSEAIVA